MTTRNGRTAVLCLIAGLTSAPALGADDSAPLWAYPVRPPQAAPAPRTTPDPTPRSVPGSTLQRTFVQANDPFNAADWHPEDHPPAPSIVMEGRRIEACAHCHLPNGMGTNIYQVPALAGLSADYIIQQTADFVSGARKSSVTDYKAEMMMQFALKPASAEDIKIAAEYFASLKPMPWFRVVEAARVPATKFENGMLIDAGSGAMEPIGKRVVELPEDYERTRYRDTRSGFVAYVPPGSIKRGEALVTAGGKGKTIACGTCHGDALQGLGPVPPLAGRSPNYIVRQLYDFQQGTRAGKWSQLMVPVVAQLTADDMLAIAAYAASRQP